MNADAPTGNCSSMASNLLPLSSNMANISIARHEIEAGPLHNMFIFNAPGPSVFYHPPSIHSLHSHILSLTLHSQDRMLTTDLNNEYITGMLESSIPTYKFLIHSNIIHYSVHR